MGFDVRLESTLAEDWGHAMTLVTHGLRGAVDKALEDGEAEGKRVKTYKDRTSNLTKSIGNRITKIDAYGAEGVLEATEKYASYVEGGTKPHEIRPKRASMLAWEEPQGDWHFAKVVHHPGTKAMPFFGPAYIRMQASLEASVDVACEKAQAAFPDGE